MDIKEVLGKVNGVIGKLPFVKLAEKIPEGARTKVPFLNTLIPFANHIGSGLAVVVLAAALGGLGGGGLAGTTWEGAHDSLFFSGYQIFTFGNNTFTQENPTGSFNGTYEVHGNTIMLLYSGGQGQTLTIDGNTITGSIGGVNWTLAKQGGKPDSGNSGGSDGASAKVVNGGKQYVIPDSDFRYELSADGKGVNLLEYTGPGGNIIIPTEIEGLPIVQTDGTIGFSNVTSAVIPDYYLPMWQEMYEIPYEQQVGNIHLPFWFDDTLETITFPKGIKYIPSQFFQSNKALKSFTIPDTVTEIHATAFGYSGLTSIVIPEGVTVISPSSTPGGVFQGCRDLKSITLPESIREIGGKAFKNCSNLETVNLPSHQIEFEYQDAFIGCTKLSLAAQQALRNAGYTGSFQAEVF